MSVSAQLVEALNRGQLRVVDLTQPWVPFEPATVEQFVLWRSADYEVPGGACDVSNR